MKCYNSFCRLRDYDATQGCLAPTIDVKQCPQRLLYLRIHNRMKKIKQGNEGRDLYIREVRRFQIEFRRRGRDDE